MSETEAYLLAAAIMATSGWSVTDVKLRSGGDTWMVVANRGSTLLRLNWPEEWVKFVWREHASPAIGGER